MARAQGGLDNGRELFPSIELTWNHLHDVTEEMSFNLKEAMKMLLDIDSDVFGQSLQNQETRRKMCGKKAISRVDRALRQLASHQTHMEELKRQMHTMRDKLETSQGAQMEVLQREQAVASQMQEAMRRLEQEQEAAKAMALELDAAKVEADTAKRSVSGTASKLQLKEVEHKRLLEDITCLKIQNEKLQRALERKVKVDTNEKTNSCLSGQVERYKEVVARLTADNMLHEYKDALLTANKRHQQLEKEIEDKKGRWIAKASAKIEDVVKSTFCQAEECETQLERLRRDEGKAVSEWQLKLEHAEKRLAHVTAARDWLEEAVVHTRERITMMEGEKLSLQGELDSERQRRLGLEGDARALALTLRESTQQVSIMKDQYSAALRNIETKSKDLQFKEHEMKQLLAALETANHRLETQQNVNAAIMRKKEEIEWQLLEAEAQRNKS
ncbi:uncharacterized protein [Physcomitrium patens]|uniref:uncharacterized protein isoform X3 n=1 Tax=Physcomitrium patens TaxID=3218 RepID=UPI003CCD98FB